MRIVQDMTSQQEIFASFLGKFCLYNCVEVPTRGENVLDLILTNDEDLIPSIKVEESGSFSDHRWVIGSLDVNMVRKEEFSPEFQSYHTKIPNFNWRKGSVEQWDQYRDILNRIDWSDSTKQMSVRDKVDYLNSQMEAAVGQVFENLLERKKFKRKRIPRDIRTLYKRKSSISKKIHKTKCKEKLGRLIVDLEIVEQELRGKKEASRRKEEDEVIEQIKVNPKVFYS